MMPSLKYQLVSLLLSKFNVDGDIFIDILQLKCGLECKVDLIHPARSW